MSTAPATARTARLAGLGMAAIMALLLLLLCFARLAGDATSMAFKNAVLDSVLEGPLWATALGRNIALFVGALLLLHFGFGLLCWSLARVSEHAFPAARVSRVQWVILWFLFLAASVLVANAALFPHSSLGEPYAQFVRTPLWSGANPFMVVIGSVAVAVVGATATSATRWIRARQVARVPAGAAAVASVAAVALLIAASTLAPGATADKPHVIIIGIDSLRYDSTGASGKTPIAPNVSRFLAESVRFSDATTPLARTFPSWVSILTGRHPHTTGAVVNLLPRDLITAGDTLGDMLRRAGYRTVYGIDEVRFSNVDESYGFDEAVAPPIGASDFVIGWFGDTPLSNLVMNSRVGAVLFPHLYANRGAAVTYDPDEFIHRLDRALSFDEPTFLAAHLTLVHWPFRWADSPKLPEAPEDAEWYSTVVERVDRQFADLLSMLERRGALRNAVVVVLSDHGEALGGMEDTLLPSASHLGEAYRSFETAYGHGTSVLSPPQYQVVLGIRAFGASSVSLPAPKVIDSPVSLEDVTPTLADLLDLDARGTFDGRSLVPLFRPQPAAAEQFRSRIRFTETEFNPAGLMSSGVVSVSPSVVAEAVTYYTVDRITDRVEVRRGRVGEILRDRQYAAFVPGRLLAALPAASGGFELIEVGRDGRATRLTPAHEPGADAQLTLLRSALEHRFDLTRRSSPDRTAE